MHDKNLSLLQDYCHDYGMVINQSKAKFFVIHGSGTDSDPIVGNGLVVEPCGMNVYLGSPFTNDGSAYSAVRAHANSRLPHVLKFV